MRCEKHDPKHTAAIEPYVTAGLPCPRCVLELLERIAGAVEAGHGRDASDRGAGSAQAIAELVVCPVCEVEPGTPCVSALGMPFAGFHNGRLRKEKRRAYERPTVRDATAGEIRRVLAIQLRDAARELELPADYSGSVLVRLRSVLAQLEGGNAG